MHASVRAESGRAQCVGKFLQVEGDVFLVRGVAYGSFAPRADGHQFPARQRVWRDFELMRAAGINTVRTYTVPPPDLLDAAVAHGLRVMAGIAWPQYVAFLDDRKLSREIIRAIGVEARSIADHPALLLTAIGNEIPPSVVRWLGRRRVERFLRDAFDEARSAAPGMLLTYVNYPPTEFLDLPFLDVHAFNVYLHDEHAMRAYIARLQHIAAGRPLLLTECGADSRRLGEDAQARIAAMQVGVALAEGAAGVVVFSWTDEWWRGGCAIEDWAFGLVDRGRRPKPAYAAVARLFASGAFSDDARRRWPSVSVVVCAYNAASTMDDCLRALSAVDYPDVEIIVVDDGSTDETAAITREYPNVRLVRVGNGGLSAARNIGAEIARGDIVAYVDADVRVDPRWLAHLVQPFITSDVVAAGGPNVAPADDPWFAQCVARAPGAPNHVLLDDRTAEHVPGCNFAVRRAALLAIGGFDRIFLRAGDDVDVCWRLQEEGGLVGFSAAALVWHHHRARLSAYWRQQVGYGEGEAWLRARHRHRFVRQGVAWRGRIYSGLPYVQSLSQQRLHSGVWGSAPFPAVYFTGAHPMQSLPHTPEWQAAAAVLLVAGLAMFLAGIAPAAGAAVGGIGAAGLLLTLAKCLVYASRSDVARLPPIVRGPGWLNRFLYTVVIAWLHVVQPHARAYGYLKGRLNPPPDLARARASSIGHLGPGLLAVLGRPRSFKYWSESWAGAEALLTRVVERLRSRRVGTAVHVDDGWRGDRDVTVSLGVWGSAHLQALVEDHGTGRCLFRARVQVRPRRGTLASIAVAATAIVAACAYGPSLVAVLAAAAGVVALLGVARAVGRDAREIVDVVDMVASELGMTAMSRRSALRRRDVEGGWEGGLPRPEITNGA